MDAPLFIPKKFTAAFLIILATTYQFCLNYHTQQVSDRKSDMCNFRTIQ